MPRSWLTEFGLICLKQPVYVSVHSAILNGLYLMGLMFFIHVLRKQHVFRRFTAGSNVIISFAY